ncbi:hypothetical protein [Rickettsia amblyommatis]|uniref:hypothetical protein n=1 Tax=Rickettsia amblyommatis TaxID=33989 RepID=UPI00359FB723
MRSENIGPKTFFSLIKLFGDTATAIDNVPDFSLRGGKSNQLKFSVKAMLKKS